jgi:hypothetical protein
VIPKVEFRACPAAHPELEKLRELVTIDDIPGQCQSRRGGGPKDQ